jgi:hypothetical protein
MAEYYVKRTKQYELEVAKFLNGASEPEAVYTVATEVQNNIEMPISCNCPRWSRKNTIFCRHTKMVEKFLNQGEPVPFVHIQE